MRSCLMILLPFRLARLGECLTFDPNDGHSSTAGDGEAVGRHRSTAIGRFVLRLFN